MTSETDWVPVSACTLPTTEQPLRVAEFDAFFGAHLTAAERLDDTRARLTLASGTDVTERAKDLADRETGCCSFFTFTVTERPDHVRMGISVPAAHASVLEALVARARSMREGRAS